MKCPHLSVASNKRICILMKAQGLEEEVGDFDVRHYCKGNPNHCYFYRLCRAQKSVADLPKESKPTRIQVVFFDELSNLKLGEAEIPVDADSSPPLHFKLVKKGLRHRVKPVFIEHWDVAVSKVK